MLLSSDSGSDDGIMNTCWNVPPMHRRSCIPSYSMITSQNHIESTAVDRNVSLCVLGLFQADHKCWVPAAATQLSHGRALVSSGLLQLWVKLPPRFICCVTKTVPLERIELRACCQSKPSLHLRTSSDSQSVTMATDLVLFFFFWLSKSSLSSKISFLGEQNN